MQITLGRVFVSVTMLAVALGLSRLALPFHSVEILFIAWLLGSAAIGNVFKRPFSFALVGLVVGFFLFLP